MSDEWQTVKKGGKSITQHREAQGQAQGQAQAQAQAQVQAQAQAQVQAQGQAQVQAQAQAQGQVQAQAQHIDMHMHVHTFPTWCNKTTKKTETPLTQLTPGWVYLRRAPTGGPIEYKYGPVLIKETYEALQREETRKGNVIFNRRLRQECERVERDWHALGDLSDYHDPRGKYEAYARSVLVQNQGYGAESD